MRRLVLVATLTLWAAAPAGAGLPATRAQVLLRLAGSSVELRSQLQAYADSARAADRYGAGEALYFAGLSFHRAGLSDSAVACLRRAVELRGAYEEIGSLADELLLRGAPGDLAEARALLTPWLVSESSATTAALVGRYAWILFQQGRADSAAALLESVAPRLEAGLEWRYRMARVSLARQDYRRAVDLLLPNAEISRGMDRSVTDLLDRAAKELQMQPRVADEVLRQIHARDKVEEALAASLGGRRLAFRARDGFRLGGIAVPPARRARARAVVVLGAPEDTLSSWDSLAVALHRRGYAVLLLHVRGSGTSVAPSCPLPDAWFGREEVFHTRVAMDVRDGLRALAKITPVDTTRYLVAGAWSTASMAVEAATLDRRIRALLLVSPVPVPTERGIARARLSRLQLPVYFQIAPEDYAQTWEITDALFQAGNQAVSRVAESDMPGRGAAQFAADPQLAARFLNWLNGAWPAPRRAPRATPPSPRR